MGLVWLDCSLQWVFNMVRQCEICFEVEEEIEFTLELIDDDETEELVLMCLECTNSLVG